MRKYLAQNGANACRISSGNALTVTLEKSHSEPNLVIVSNHAMQPGDIFTVNVNGKSFETSEANFSSEQAKNLLDSLMKGESAYMDWSEINGPDGGQRIHVQNIVRLDDFRPLLEQCYASVM